MVAETIQNDRKKPDMKKTGLFLTIKKYGLLPFIRAFIAEIRDTLRRRRDSKRYQQRKGVFDAALEHQKRGDLAPMESLAHATEPLGDAWLALASFYAAHRSEDQALATQTYRNAVQCPYENWLHPAERNRAINEYDRRRFLGIGVAQDFQTLAEEWENRYEPGYEREMQLAWIYTHGPVKLRDRKEAWRWVALGEARWGNRCHDVELPTSSAAELREILNKSVSITVQRRLKAEMEAEAYGEFVYRR